MHIHENFQKIFVKSCAIDWPSIEFAVLKQCECVKPWGEWRDFQIQLSLRTHRLLVLKSGWRVTIISSRLPPHPFPVAVAVDANFIRWSFNSRVTTLECNLLGNVVSHRIEIDRSRGPRSGIWRVSHCLHI